VWVVRRAVGAGKNRPDAGLVLSTLRTLLKAAVWVAALALILSVLGFDVTAIVAGLGIGGLAIGLAAQPRPYFPPFPNHLRMGSMRR
jgi:small-conductance mechanosensitive channel